MIALFSILSSTVCAQIQIADSLINVLNTQKLTPAQQLALYKDITGHLLNYDNKKFFVYAEKGLTLADKVKDKDMTAKFYGYLGKAYCIMENYEKGLVYFEKALAYFQKNQNEREIASVYVHIATSIYKYQLKYEESLKYYMKALPIYENLGDKEGILIVFINMADIHIAIQSYDKAVSYLEQAKPLAEELNRKGDLSGIYFSLGDIYLWKQEHDKALEQELKAVEIAHALGYDEMEACALMDLAQIYVRLEDYDTAEAYLKQVFPLLEKQGQAINLKIARLILANIFLEQKRYQECDALATIVYHQDSVDVRSGKFAAQIITVSNIFLGNKNKAKYFFYKCVEYEEQSNKEDVIKSLSEMEVKYETEKKELRIAALEKEKTLYIGWSITGGALLLFLLLFFIHRNRLELTKRKLAEQQIQQVAAQSVLDGETAERTRLARDLHDGLGGMLSAVKLNLDNFERLSDAREMLNKSIDELRRVAHHLMPESLLQSGLKTSLEDFCLSIPNAKFHYFGNESRLNDRTEILIYRCAHELVNNAIKYSGADTINIQLVQDTGRISLTVHDNGCGFDPEKHTEGMGLKNLRNRITAYNGKMNIYSAPGKGMEAYVELRVEN
ncbi:hypothetical protein FACS189413_16410 [Bacteroidia bacterium]|nr:hypothetical protein FACS189413_16410 [Bacteroidia bacterium]